MMATSATSARGRLTPALVEQALTSLSYGEVEEGDVGAGAGTVAFGWKGGIGTSSRGLTATTAATPSACWCRATSAAN